MVGQDIERGIVCFVARNNVHLTKRAVKSAFAQDMVCPVAVVDNASTDGTNAWLNTQNIGHATFGKQKSLAYCWNYMLKFAWKLGCEHALVCNNDIELRPDAYRLLAAHGGPFVTCVSVRTVEELNYPNPPTSERPSPDFSAFLIRRSVTDTIGWFDESYFPCYTEDCDMHVRMWRAGIKAVCIDLPFLHHGAATLNAADEGEQARIKRGADANREKFRQTYGCLPGTPEYDKLFQPAL